MRAEGFRVSYYCMHALLLRVVFPCDCSLNSFIVHTGGTGCARQREGHVQNIHELKRHKLLLEALRFDIFLTSTVLALKADAKPRLKLFKSCCIMNCSSAYTTFQKFFVLSFLCDVSWNRSEASFCTSGLVLRCLQSLMQDVLLLCKGETNVALVSLKYI